MFRNLYTFPHWVGFPIKSPSHDGPIGLVMRHLSHMKKTSEMIGASKDKETLLIPIEEEKEEEEEEDDEEEYYDMSE